MPTLQEVVASAQELMAMYAFLLKDTETLKHDIDSHNLCSAVVGFSGYPSATLYSYSNPSSLSAKRFDQYDFVKANGIGDLKIINRGTGPMSPDKHTEIRLLNHIYREVYTRTPTSITFFSTRTVCGKCRPQIYNFIEQIQIPVMAWEFRAEIHGRPTNKVWSITEGEREAATINWETGEIV